jgi:hypothetical protein
MLTFHQLPAPSDHGGMAYLLFNGRFQARTRNIAKEFMPDFYAYESLG